MKIQKSVGRRRRDVVRARQMFSHLCVLNLQSRSCKSTGLKHRPVTRFDPAIVVDPDPTVTRNTGSTCVQCWPCIKVDGQSTDA